MLKPQKNLVVKSGKLSFTTKIQGKLTEAAPQINALITNFNATETLNNIKISIRELLIDAKTDKNIYSGIVTLNDILCVSKNIPNSSNTIKSQVLSAKFDNKTLTINPSKINLGNAKIVLSGNITDYLKSPTININASGTVDTALLKTFAPKDIKLFAQGYLPIKASVTGNSREQKIKIDILANHSNYITPLHINSFAAINTLTSAEAKLEGPRLGAFSLSILYLQHCSCANGPWETEEKGSFSVTFPQQFARRAARLRSQRPLRYTYSHYGAVAPRPTQGGHS